MKNKFICILFSFLINIALSLIYAQSESYVLSSNESGANKEFVAKNHITLKSGFSYIPNDSFSFSAKIIPTLLFPPDSNLYKTPAGIITSVVNGGGIVGRIKGDVNVSDYGSLNYTIPLDIPIGIKEMHPSISLSYNSQMSNGMLGLGWSVTGLSSVNRVGRTYINDGDNLEIQFTTKDNLEIDGKRLHLSRGEFFMKESRYMIENEIGSEVILKESGGKLFFEVYSKDGLVRIYGATDDSNINVFSKGETLSWLLNKVIDKNGNYISYEYEKQNNPIEYTLKKISYTGNERIQDNPINEILFDYSNKENVQNAYVSGIEIASSKLLRQINILSRNKLYRKYSFDYYTENCQLEPKLKSIDVESGDGTKLNPTNILWAKDGDKHIKYGDEYSINIKDIDPWRIFEDFDGDGKKDVISINKNNNTFTLFLNTDIYNNVSFLKKKTVSIYGDQLQDVFCADLDGDSFVDVICVVKAPNGTFRYNYYFYDGDSFVMKGGFNAQAVNNDYLIGDFNGNGRNDIAIRSMKSFFDYRGEKFGNIDINWGKEFASFFPNNLSLLDFNGNSKADIITRDDSKAYVYELTNGNMSLLFETSEFNNSSDVYPGDYNGDGKTDLCVIKRKPSGLDCYMFWLISTGKGFKKLDLPDLKILNVIKGFKGDFNLDGKTDIMFARRVNNYFHFTIGVNNGQCFDFKNVESNISCTDPYLWRKIDMGDYDGDGRSEIIYQEYNNYWSYKSFFDDHSRLVYTIIDGMNEAISFDYKPMTDRLACTREKRNNDESICNKQIPLNLLTSMISKDKRFTFNYIDPLYHTGGLGFRGFEKVIKSDMVNNISTTTEYELGKYFYNLLPRKIITSANQSQKISEVTNEYSSKNSYKSNFFSYVAKSTNIDCLTTLETVKMYDYDNYGRPILVESKVGDNREINKFEYYQNIDLKIGNVAKVINLRIKSADQHERVYLYEYDELGNLQKEIVDPGDINSIEKRYNKIDIFGNPQEVELISNGISRKEFFKFTSSGRFISSKTDAKNKTSNFVWDENKGVLLSEQNDLGETKYLYNGMQQISQIIYPDGKRKCEVLRWEKADNPIGALYSKYSEVSGSSPNIIYFNDLGQEIGRESVGLNNKRIYTLIEYNSSGKVHKISSPSHSFSQVIWEQTYHYDLFGRVSLVNTTKGDHIYKYTGLTTETISPEGNKKVIYNLSNELESVIDNGKKITYEYYASGEVKSILPDGGEKIIFKYDLQNNKIEMNDPDGGIMKYKYNGFGALIEDVRCENDAIEEVLTTYSYSDNGLLLLKNVNGQTTKYKYDSKNRLEIEEIIGKHKQAYEYDYLSRVVSVKEYIDGKEFVTRKEYDSFGRVKKEIFPSMYFVCYNYDKYGNKVEVIDKNNKTVWKILEENLKGQITKTSNGNAEILYEYDENGLPVSIKSGQSIDMLYKFDNKNNLLSRKDNLTNQEEMFLYDTHNRLTNWDVYKDNLLIKQNNIAYDQITGNIKSKSDIPNAIFNYGENGSGSHSLTSIVGSEIKSAPDLNISYTNFNKVERLSEGDRLYEIEYGVDNERRISKFMVSDKTIRKRYYIGNYEEVVDDKGNIKKIHYLDGAIFIQNMGRDSLLYAYLDFQGSLLALSNEQGKILERYAYDPWGNRRNVDDWSKSDNRKNFIVNKGYTSHEHIDEFSLINMNGRMYDPQTSMFLSPDPFIQSPESWGNFNRYTYCMGNPFKFIDPSGNSFWSIFGTVLYGIASVMVGVFNPPLGVAMIGAYLGASIANKQFDIFKWDFQNANTYLGVVAGFSVGLAATALVGAALQSSLSIRFSSVIYDAIKISVDFTIKNGTIIFEAAGYSTAALGGAYITYESIMRAKNERPDKDGYLTLMEAKYWYLNGNGQHLTVDANLIKYPDNLSADKFDSDGEYILRLEGEHRMNANDGLVHGSITLKLNEERTGFKIVDGYYDFDQHSTTGWRDWRTRVRNVLTSAGEWVNTNYWDSSGRYYNRKGTKYMIQYNNEVLFKTNRR